jgi:putative ABC transport system ATP-binding protein
MTALLEARQVGYTVRGQRILADVDLSVQAGGRLAVTGPSGSGKISLLAVLAGLVKPTQGVVLLDGECLRGIAGPAKGVATVLEGYGLVSLLTAAENVEVALRAAGRSPRDAVPEAKAALAQVGLSAHTNHLVLEATRIGAGQRAHLLRQSMSLAVSKTATVRAIWARRWRMRRSVLRRSCP